MTNFKAIALAAVFSIFALPVFAGGKVDKQCIKDARKNMRTAMGECRTKAKAARKECKNLKGAKRKECRQKAKADGKACRGKAKDDGKAARKTCFGQKTNAEIKTDAKDKVKEAKGKIKKPW